MILKRLVEFAERQPDALSTGFQPKFVTKVVRLDSDGSLVQVLTGGPDKRGKKPGWQRNEPMEAPMRTVGVVPRLFSDNACYVLGRAREKDKPEVVQKRHQAWVDLALRCAREVNLPETGAMARWIESGGPAAMLDSVEAADDDEFTFEVEGRFLTDLPEVRRWWAAQADSASMGRCIVTGVYGPVVDRMPAPIKGIPGGQVSGTALISVNNAAGESYGLWAALNSPISPDAAEKIGNGLNLLINESSPAHDENGRERRVFRHSHRLGRTIYLAWTREEQEFSFFDFLDSPDPQQVLNLLKEPAGGGDGREGRAVDESDFYVLCLTANVSRVVVRDYIETTLVRAKRSLAKWFDSLAIVGLEGAPHRPPGVFGLAASLQRELKDVPAHVPAQLMASAVTGRPLPASLLGLAVKRNLAMQGPFHEFNKVRRLCIDRLALIKAVLEQQEGIPLTHLNTQHPDAAYHCGRLLAVLEQIQRAALGKDVNTTLVDRWYGSACTSPGAVLGSLLNGAQAHLSKLRKGSGDGWAQQRLGEVLQAMPDGFPRTLSLHRQGLFALGYYHQKAHDLAAAIQAKQAKDQALQEAAE